MIAVRTDYDCSSLYINHYHEIFRHPEIYGGGFLSSDTAYESQRHCPLIPAFFLEGGEI